jgi:hypothetical protein
MKTIVSSITVLFRVGFNNTTTIEKICKTFPELDMVNHNHRTKLVGFVLNFIIVSELYF